MSSQPNLPVRRRPKQNAKSSNFSLYLLGGVMLLLIIFVIALNIWNSRPVITAQPLDIQSGWVDRNSIGSPDAKVVVEAYEDFLCSHCGEFTAQVEPRLFDEYVKTGKVRFVYRTFPLQGFEPGASIAANAAMCAAEQNQFGDSSNCQRRCCTRCSRNTHDFREWRIVDEWCRLHYAQG